MDSKRPLIFVISGPGGVGKGTMVHELVTRDDSLWLSKSWTTRSRRPSETEDSYEFVDESTFRRRIDEGGFLEWVNFLGNFYGTPTPDPPTGMDVLLEIELEGAQIVRGKIPEVILVLVVPPSEEVQRERLLRRGESPERIEERVQRGRDEMNAGGRLADEIVVNDDLETAVQALSDIVNKYRRLRS